MSTKITDIGSVQIGGSSINIESLLKEGAENNPDLTEEDVVSQIEDEVVQELYSTPVEDWRQECESISLSMNEASKILDVIMTTGFYESTYKISGKVFKFRTRTTIDGDRLIEMLRELKPENNAILSHLIARINIASSLACFGDVIFSHTRPMDHNRDVLDQEWKDRWTFTSSLPQPIFLALSQTLQVFDEKVNLACDARALENF